MMILFDIIESSTNNDEGNYIMTQNMNKLDRDAFLACLQLAVQTITKRNDLCDPTIEMIDELNDPNGNPGWFNSAATENRFMGITNNVGIILKGINIAHLLTCNNELSDYADRNLKYIFGNS